MSILPDIDKTWQVVQNLGHTSVVAMLLDIKNTLKGFAQSPWTVRYSCSSTVAGTAGDLVDRWVTTANVVRGANGSSARSWIVLRQVGLAMNGDPGMELLFDYVGSAAENGSWYISYGAGFTGGTTTSRPTASDEVEISSISQWTALGASSYRVHVHLSTDGQCTRVFMMQNGISCGFWIVDKIKNAHPELTHPVCANVLGVGNTVSEVMTVSNYVNTNRLRVYQDGFHGLSYMTAEGCNNTTIMQLFPSTDDLNNGWVLSPIGVACTTSPITGRYGQLFDLWLTATGAPSGMDFDETGSREFGTLKDFVVISNGEILSIE